MIHTEEFKNSIGASLQQVIGGEWTWHPEQKVFQALLPDSFFTVLDSGGYKYTLTSKGIGSTSTVAMTNDEALLNIYSASDIGHGDSRPSVLNEHLQAITLKKPLSQNTR